MLTHFRELANTIALKLSEVAVFFFVGFLIEAIVPIEDHKSGKHTLFNCLYAALYRSCDVIIGAAFAASVVTLVNKLPIHGVIHLAKLGWALPIVTLMAYDFFYYWMHRTQHFSRWLWAEHELHHSDEQVDVTTGTRHHYFELFLMPIFIYSPLAIVFDVSGNIAMSWVLVMQLFIYFIHMNARIGFGPLNRLVANPQVHRIHHSKERQHFDKNFAAYFPIWDVIFGTYYHPKRGEYPLTGLPSGRIIHSQLEAAMLPVTTWARMLRQRSPRFTFPFFARAISPRQTRRALDESMPR